MAAVGPAEQGGDSLFDRLRVMERAASVFRLPETVVALTNQMVGVLAGHIVMSGSVLMGRRVELFDIGQEGNQRYLLDFLHHGPYGAERYAYSANMGVLSVREGIWIPRRLTNGEDSMALAAVLPLCEFSLRESQARAAQLEHSYVRDGGMNDISLGRMFKEQPALRDMAILLQTLHVPFDAGSLPATHPHHPNRESL
jgi:hypothetical protein